MRPSRIIAPNTAQGAIIFVEGGGDNRATRAFCREGFRVLLQKCGYPERRFQIIACGTRLETYKQFKSAHAQGRAEFVAMLVDSEDAVKDINQPWAHLKAREYDRWERPAGADDRQVFLMTTCMETWIVADRAALLRHYNAGQDGKKKRSKQAINEGGLPPLHDLEAQHRHDVQDRLEDATRHCSNKYQKGERSFEPFAELDPDILQRHLPSFARMREILDAQFPDEI